MDNLIEVAQVIGASTTFLNAILFIWLSFVPRISRGVEWWAAGLVIGLAGFLIFSLPHMTLGDTDISSHLYSLSELLFTMCIAIGTRQFVGKPDHKRAFAYGVVVTVVAALALDWLLDGYTAYFTVIALFNGVVIMTTGYLIYKHPLQNWPFWPQAIGVVFMVWGVHWLDAPVLMQFDALFEFGFIFALLISNLAVLGYAALMLHTLIARIMAAEQKAINLSLRDDLTLLWNRRYLDDVYANYRNNAQRHGHQMAFIYIDLDHFKPVNDTHGHEAGDEVLRQVAQRILDVSRTSDVALRVGGDEFLVFIPQMEADVSILPQAKRLRERICEPIQINAETVTVGTSIGIAIFPDHGADLDQLMERADVAMYNVKNTGRNGEQLYV